MHLMRHELDRATWSALKAACHPSDDFVPARKRFRERVRNGDQ